jgi:hypothetical protein
VVEDISDVVAVVVENFTEVVAVVVEAVRGCSDGGGGHYRCGSGFGVGI